MPTFHRILMGTGRITIPENAKAIVHRREIGRLDEAAAKQGMTLVPTRVYLRNRRIKIEVGVARGKKMYDKRETELKRTVERETRAQLKERNR